MVLSRSDKKIAAHDNSKTLEQHLEENGVRYVQELEDFADQAKAEGHGGAWFSAITLLVNAALAMKGKKAPAAPQVSDGDDEDLAAVEAAAKSGDVEALKRLAGMTRQ